MSYAGTSRRNGSSGRPERRSNVAGASPSQNATRGRPPRGTGPSAPGQSAKHPPPLALTPRSGAAAVVRQGLGLLGVGEQPGELLLHLGAVARHQVVAPDPEEPLAVVPGRRDEGDATGERFEHPDGGDAGERARVRTPRDVYRHL